MSIVSSWESEWISSSSSSPSISSWLSMLSSERTDSSRLCVPLELLLQQSSSHPPSGLASAVKGSAAATGSTVPVAWLCPAAADATVLCSLSSSTGGGRTSAGDSCPETPDTKSSGTKMEVSVSLTAKVMPLSSCTVASPGSASAASDSIRPTSRTGIRTSMSGHTAPPGSRSCRLAPPKPAACWHNVSELTSAAHSSFSKDSSTAGLEEQLPKLQGSDSASWSPCRCWDAPREGTEMLPAVGGSGATWASGAICGFSVLCSIVI
mmetsp:Transcript_30935/g.72141  ORF Transcript_30935/g.72141 Transcript_30935/m.72141 type:complete len:265 (+) Transcript_30935:1526-2320(+)